MAEYVSARDAVLRELESAENALKGAEREYEKDRQAAKDAQVRMGRSYDGCEANSRNVIRLKRALAILEGDDRG